MQRRPSLSTGAVPRSYWGSLTPSSRSKLGVLPSNPATPTLAREHPFRLEPKSFCHSSIPASLLHHITICHTLPIFARLGYPLYVKGVLDNAQNRGLHTKRWWVLVKILQSSRRTQYLRWLPNQLFKISVREYSSLAYLHVLHVSHVTICCQRIRWPPGGMIL